MTIQPRRGGRLLCFAVLAVLINGKCAGAQEAANDTPEPDAVAGVANVDSKGSDSKDGNSKDGELAAHQAREEAFNRAANEYLEHRNASDWRVRVGIDRRLLRAAGKLPPQYLAARLDASPGSMEISTSVAVCLGEGSPGDPPELVAELLTELLGSPIERVRYRAAEAIIQRIQDGTMPGGLEARLSKVLDEAIARETNSLNVDSMKYAGKLLSEQVAGE